MVNELDKSKNEKQFITKRNEQIEEDITKERKELERVSTLLKEKTDEMEQKVKNIEGLEIKLTDMRSTNEQRAMDIENNLKTIEENAKDIKALTGENKVLSNKIEYIKTKSAQAGDDL